MKINFFIFLAIIFTILSVLIPSAIGDSPCGCGKFRPPYEAPIIQGLQEEIEVATVALDDD